MSKTGKALAVSFGALAGGATGFYVLEMYKIKSKEERLAMLLDKKRELESIQHQHQPTTATTQSSVVADSL